MVSGMSDQSSTNYQRLWVLSDLHLIDSQDALLKQVIKVMTEQLKPGDAIVFAGDIFDSFFGPKRVYFERYQVWMQWCKTLLKDYPVYFIEGNHDFQLREGFKRELLGLHWEDTELEFKVQNKRVYVAHGDLANQEDLGYLFMRWFFRSIAMRLFIKFAPDSWIDWIGLQSSRASRSVHYLLPQDFAPERLQRLRAIYHRFAHVKFAQGFQTVVLGHCHDLDQLIETQGGVSHRYFNMGFPKRHHSIVLIDSEAKRVALD